MRLVRICISVTGLALGSLLLSATGASAASPCPPGQPYGRPPGDPPGSPPGQPPGRPPQYPVGKCQLQLAAAAGLPNSLIAAAGDGFQAGSAVSLRLSSASVGSATADGNGRFTQPFTVPSDMAPGRYDAAATGVGTDGAPYELSAPFEVLTPQPASSTSPSGGSPGLPGPSGVIPGASGGSSGGSSGFFPGLRSGAGLAAAPRGGGTGLVALPGGGFAALPAGGTVGGSAGALTGSEPGVTIPFATPGDTPSGAALGPAGTAGSGSSSGINPLVAAGGGLVLTLAGAGAVVAVKRRNHTKA